MRKSILLVVFILMLSACSQTDNSDIIEQGMTDSNSYYSSKTDLDNDGKKDTIDLLDKGDYLLLKVNDSTLNLKSVIIYNDTAAPAIKIIEDKDKNKYIVQYQPNPGVGRIGGSYFLGVIKYSKSGLKLLWNGNLEDYKYKYRYENNRIYFSFPNGKEISGDISEKVSNMKLQLKRIEPLTIDQFFNGPIMTTLTAVGAGDYDGDGYGEIITQHVISNEQLGSTLSAILTIWKIDSGEIYVYKNFIADRNTFESRIMNKIIKDGYLYKKDLNSLVTEFDGDKDINKSVKWLTDNNIIVTRGSKISVK